MIYNYAMLSSWFLGGMFILLLWISREVNKK